MSPASHDRGRDLRRGMVHVPEVGLSLDVTGMGCREAFLKSMEGPLARAQDAMQELEAGAVANPTEGRRVGHYWLRAPELAPDAQIRTAVPDTLARAEEFAARVRAGAVGPPGGRFRHVLCCGIGGSALGPQLLAEALEAPDPPCRLHFLDNTDPAGFDRVLGGLGDDLAGTLVVVTSKSGGTVETRNAMEETRAALEARGLELPPRAVAVTGEGSRLDALARREGWLARFPMWDWVGGRTSLWSAVGVLPAALLGVDVRALLAGAAAMDAATRRRGYGDNPAARLALAWHHATGGCGRRDMVVLPYRDSLQLLPRYLQQLVMESLGKEQDLQGRTVHQGIAVYGNKGSTDQHALVQQLRDGVPNAFTTFVHVLEEGGGPRAEVEPGITSGDHLHAFMLGTRRALEEKGRPCLTITLEKLGARSLGGILALFERAVGLYASLVNVNAYDQPGVEAGKRAAGSFVELQGRLLQVLKERDGSLGVEDAAAAAGAGGREREVLDLLRHLAANRREVVQEGAPEDPAAVRYRWDEGSTGGSGGPPVAAPSPEAAGP